ncbi:MAG: glycosyl hydrolase repeat-containing protein, partial [Chitinophagaceae bacterium]|nr:glycosyl hydrolase repeat-containing protein [Chitinophagaceae bacterium]
MRILLAIAGIAMLAINPLSGYSQKKPAAIDPKKETDALSSSVLNGLRFRSVGPAITSGRIGDIAVNPDNFNEYYVAVASGGVWKTTNAGLTFTPVFDKEGSYSIGCVTMDPSNSSVIWVGSGENNNQRSVAYGDGVYKSEDGGATWKNVGLKNSEHIGRIVVDPSNSDVVYVAAYGPVWSSGGDRGIYKTTDGGKTWKNILSVSEHTGFNEIHMDPRDPKVLYAAAHQRQRKVFTYIGGGPESALYKSTDGGQTWNKIMTGMPTGDVGRIGLAISPANPDVVYAIVEAAEGGGVYRSNNRGASWSKQGTYTSSGNYYQEIFADPKNVDKLYAMNAYMVISTDGGKNFKILGEKSKHIDNHAMWINPTNTDHYIVGSDGGLYETWDAAANWHFKPNLPVTQFYKVATDNAWP